MSAKDDFPNKMMNCVLSPIPKKEKKKKKKEKKESRKKKMRFPIITNLNKDTSEVHKVILYNLLQKKKLYYIITFINVMIV